MRKMKKEWTDHPWKERALGCKGVLVVREKNCRKGEGIEFTVETPMRSYASIRNYFTYKKNGIQA